MGKRSKPAKSSRDHGFADATLDELLEYNRRAEIASSSNPFPAQEVAAILEEIRRREAAGERQTMMLRITGASSAVQVAGG